MTQAIRKDHEHVVSWLLKHRLFHLKQRGQPTEPHPLILAVELNSIKSARVMLEFARDRNEKSQLSEGSTSGGGAAKGSGRKRVVVLPAAGFTDSQGVSMLMIAVRKRWTG